MRGFTLIELVTVLVLVGVLSAVALPSLSGIQSFRATEFRAEVVAGLRFAQKVAVSHRRLVCAAFASNSLTLSIDHDRNGTCDGRAINLPGRTSNVIQGAGAGANFTTVPQALFFQPDGRIFDAGGNTVSLSLTIDGVTVLLEGRTGYVGAP